MNYKESKKILDEIKKAKRILINCHQSPDPDSFSTALSLRKVLLKMGKEVSVVCTSESSLMKEASFMEGYDEIERVDYSKFNFSDYDLLISPDTADWNQFVGRTEIPKPKIKIVVIDHHATNQGFGKINLIDADSLSCAEVLFRVFEDWGITVEKELANLLLVGIISDTGGFQYSGASKSLITGSKLVEKGANLDEIMLNFFRNKTFNSIKMMGDFLSSMELDKEHGFVYMALPYEAYKKYGKPAKLHTFVANLFSNAVDGTLFGITLIEYEPNQTNASFRGRGDFDVSEMAVALGGGGHKATAAATVRDLPFYEAVEKVLKTAQKYAKKN
jgi:phosphoesterase RecJ-like protein